MTNPIETLSATKAPRPTFIYTVPKKIPGTIRRIGMVELTMDEQLMASKTSYNEPARFVMELAKLALVGYAESEDAKNLITVSVGDGSADRLWKNPEQGGMSSKIREMVISAYQKIHTADNQDTEDFLKSEEVLVQ